MNSPVFNGPFLKAEEVKNEPEDELEPENNEPEPENEEEAEDEMASGTVADILFANDDFGNVEFLDDMSSCYDEDD